MWNIILPANTRTFIYFRFYIYTKDLIAHWHAIFCIFLAQRKDVIIPDGPYGSGTISLNKGLQT